MQVANSEACMRILKESLTTTQLQFNNPSVLDLQQISGILILLCDHLKYLFYKHKTNIQFSNTGDLSASSTDVFDCRECSIY